MVYLSGFDCTGFVRNAGVWRLSLGSALAGPGRIPRDDLIRHSYLKRDRVI